jgi:hypothetical protein
MQSSASYEKRPFFNCSKTPHHLIKEEGIRLSETKQKELANEALEKIREALIGLKYGSVQVVVHDSKIVEIHRLDKHRIPLQKEK